MRKLSILLVLFTAILNAQNITSSGTNFVEEIKSKKWSNANGTDFTKASFSNFDGSVYVVLEVDTTTEVSFESLTKLKNGRLEVKLIDEEDNNYFYCDATKKCEVQKVVRLEKAKKYRLYFTGKNAKGSYQVHWEIK